MSSWKWGYSVAMLVYRRVISGRVSPPKRRPAALRSARCPTVQIRSKENGRPSPFVRREWVWEWVWHGGNETTWKTTWGKRHIFRYYVSLREFLVVVLQAVWVILVVITLPTTSPTIISQGRFASFRVEIRLLLFVYLLMACSVWV